MTRQWLAGLALGTSLLLGSAASAQDIVIAVAGPMTGSEAAFGAQLRNGAMQAVEDINKAGGILGRKVRLEIGDDACDPKQARAVAEKLSGMKPALIVGHFCSSSSIPASEVYLETNVVQITPASTNPQFTERKMWNVFRTCGRDDQQGTVAGRYLAKTYKGKNIAILHDRTTYGKGLADETKKALNRAGVKEKLYEAYTKGDKDFTALVTRMRAANIDVVYVGGYHNEAGLIVRQMRDQKMKTQLIAGDALVTDQFWGITGPAGEGTLMTFNPDARKMKSAASVVAAFKAKNIDPEGYTLYTYAAFQIWAQAVAKAKTLDSKKVAAVMKGGKWNTVLGTLSFDNKGDVRGLDYVFFVWKKDGTYSEM
jgi:branched-chain amino acid transport system substrate-binding protein